MTEDEQKTYNRVALLLTPVNHIADASYNAGVRDALEAVKGRIRTAPGEYTDYSNQSPP